MSEAKAIKGISKAYGLVRNAKGEPQFSNYEVIPEVFHEILSEEDWEFIGKKIKEQQCQSHTM
jgi:hypothetical protein